MGRVDGKVVFLTGVDSGIGRPDAQLLWGSLARG